MAAGRSLVVGVEQDGVLPYLEVALTGTVSQFLVARNGAVPRSVAIAVCSRLVGRGLLRPDGNANRIWPEA